MCAREYAGSDQLQKVLGAASFRGMSEAIARYEKMVEQFPQNELGRFSLGKALFDAGQFAKAKEHLEVALAKKPDWMVVQILIGKCDLSLADREGARAAFQRALNLAIDQHHEGPQAEMEQALREL
jgi:tetratricopeptide (TPR) repeat protein